MASCYADLAATQKEVAHGSCLGALCIGVSLATVQPPHEYKHFQRLYDSGMLLRFRDLGEVGIKRGISSFGQTCWQRKTYMRRANIDFIRSISLCWLDMISPQSFLISGSWMDALSHMRIAAA